MRNLLVKSSTKVILETALVAVAYFVAGKIGLLTAIPPAFESAAIWPTSGLAVAYLILRGPWRWQGVLLGALAFCYSVYSPFMLRSVSIGFREVALVSMGVGFAMTFQAVMLAWLVRRYIGSTQIFERASNVLNFVCFVILCCTIGTGIGAMIEPSLGIITWKNFPETWLNWCLGETIGVLTLTPILLLWSERKFSLAFSRERIPVLLTHAAIVFFASQIIFGVPFDLRFDQGQRIYLLFPLLFWITFRGGLTEGITALTITSFVAFWATATDRGPFTSGDARQSLLAVQSFIGVISVVGLAFGAALSDRKRAEDERARLLANEQRLRKALTQTNEQLSRFAHVASHDLSEPLRMVSIYLSLLERKNEEQLDEQSRQFLHFAVDGATRMKRLLESLCLYSESTVKQIKPSSVALDEILKGCLSDLSRSIARSKAQIIVEPLPSVRADEALMSQLFQNLISNAVKYRRGEMPPVIRIRARRASHMWIFSVEDNGIGFDMKYSQRIFEAFQRLHSTDFPGAGLGLSICKAIVERHDGKIWVSSEVGKGSTFYFSIPDQGAIEKPEKLRLIHQYA